MTVKELINILESWDPQEQVVVKLPGYTSLYVPILGTTTVGSWGNDLMGVLLIDEETTLWRPTRSEEEINDSK